MGHTVARRHLAQEQLQRQQRRRLRRCRRQPARDIVAVRDSKDPDGPNLTFSRDEWRAFTTSVKRGELGLD